MKVLVVDDERTFTFKVDGVEVVHARTAREGIEAIKNDRYHTIFLDHDLGTGGSGMEVAKWIRDNIGHDNIRNSAIRVHSMNPVGKINMVKTINCQKDFRAMAQTVDIGSLNKDVVEIVSGYVI